MADTVRVTCPCCGNAMVVDGASGEVLSEDRPKTKPAVSFEDAVGEVRAGAQRRQDAFDKAFDRTRRLDDLLDKKFEEAKRKAKENPDAKPTNPFDLE